jgi:hypothetical protein
MKLVLLFIVMDMLTILAYPFVFLYGKLHQFLKPRPSVDPASYLIKQIKL